MKRRSFFKSIAIGLVVIYTPIDWCIGKLRPDTILVDWARISWDANGATVVVFDVRWKAEGASDWIRTQDEVQLNQFGRTDLWLTRNHAISVDTHESCFARALTA